VDAPAHIEVYYASECTPCRLELPVLARIAADGTIPFSIVVLGDAREGLAQLAAVSANLTVLARASNAWDMRKALREAGDKDAILPFARALSAEGKLCGSWRGVLTQERMARLLALCK